MLVKIGILAGLTSQQLCKFWSGNGGAEEETLDPMAPPGRHEFHVLAPLHAFGDRLHVERAGEREDHVNDSRGLGIAAFDGAHELLIDLDDIERQLRQRRQTRMAAAEIVDGKADAGVTQRLDDTERSLGIRHDRGGDVARLRLRHSLGLVDQAELLLFELGHQPDFLALHGDLVLVHLALALRGEVARRPHRQRIGNHAREPGDHHVMARRAQPVRNQLPCLRVGREAVDEQEVTSGAVPLPDRDLDLAGAYPPLRRHH